MELQRYSFKEFISERFDKNKKVIPTKAGWTLLNGVIRLFSFFQFTLKYEEKYRKEV